MLFFHCLIIVLNNVFFCRIRKNWPIGCKSCSIERWCWTCCSKWSFHYYWVYGKYASLNCIAFFIVELVNYFASNIYCKRLIKYLTIWVLYYSSVLEFFVRCLILYAIGTPSLYYTVANRVNICNGPVIYRSGHIIHKFQFGTKWKLEFF